MIVFNMKKVILYLLFKLGDNLWKINNRHIADLYQKVMELYFKLSERWKI